MVLNCPQSPFCFHSIGWNHSWIAEIHSKCLSHFPVSPLKVLQCYNATALQLCSAALVIMWDNEEKRSCHNKLLFGHRSTAVTQCCSAAVSTWIRRSMASDAKKNPKYKEKHPTFWSNAASNSTDPRDRVHRCLRRRRRRRRDARPTLN